MWHFVFFLVIARLYAQRRIKDAFREHKCETDVNRINSLVQHAEDNLQLIKRQVRVNSEIDLLRSMLHFHELSIATKCVYKVNIILVLCM